MHFSLPPSLPPYLQRILLPNGRSTQLRRRVGKRRVGQPVTEPPLHRAVNRLEAIEGVGALLAGLGVVLMRETVFGVGEGQPCRRIDIA